MRQPVSNPRAAAAQAVGDVLHGRSLSASLPVRSAALAGQDRALAAELAYGTCRWFWRLDAIGQRLLARAMKRRDQDMRALLLIGLYQMLFTRVPAHAAVAETAGAARLLNKAWATAVLNGSLRRFQREGETLTAGLDDDPVTRYALPGWLLADLRTAWPTRWQQIAAACNVRPPMTVRVNLRRQTRDAYLQRLQYAGIGASIVADLPAALVLERPVDVSELPGFVDGCVSVQDANAQRAAWLLDLESGQRVLDACAAPGGKTGHLLEIAPDSALTAIDIDAVRLDRVRETLQRLGLDATCAVGDAGAPDGLWARQQYDRILLDVPCSATGVLRRHPDIRLLRESHDINRLASRQDVILDAVWPLLKPGGKLLYVTCSLMPMENERRIAAFTKRRSNAQPADVPGPWGEACGIGRQLFPGDASGDGFYYALLYRVPESRMP